MLMQKRNKPLDPADFTYILSSLLTSKSTCDGSAVLEGAVMALYNFNVRSPTASIINARTQLCSWLDKALEDALLSYFDVVNYLLATYATEDFIVDEGNEFTSCAQLPIVTSVSGAQKIWDEVLRSDTVCGEATLNETFIKRHPESIRVFRRHCRVWNKSSSMNDLAWQATLLNTLQAEWTDCTLLR